MKLLVFICQEISLFLGGNYGAACFSETKEIRLDRVRISLHYTPILITNLHHDETRYFDQGSSQLEVRFSKPFMLTDWRSTLTHLPLKSISKVCEKSHSQLGSSQQRHCTTPRDHLVDSGMRLDC